MFFDLLFPQFPAQVIAARNFNYRKKTFIVVRQTPGSHKSSVIACSLEATRLGIHPGMPMHMVGRRMKGIETLVHDPALDALVVEELQDICRRYTPVFTVADRGECLLDMSHTPSLRKGTTTASAMHIRATIESVTGLRLCCIGISESVIAARVLARCSNPGSVECCAVGDEPRMLALLETKHLPGLSAIARGKLKRYGITRVEQLQNLPREALISRFGIEGDKLFCLARGLDTGLTGRQAESCTVETIFDHDIVDRNDLRERVWYTADKLCNELKHTGGGAAKIVMTILYGDGKTNQRTIALSSPTSDFTAIRDRATTAFFELYQRRVSIRSLQLTVKQLETETDQIDLFETAYHRKQEALSRGILAVREKFCFDAVLGAGNVG